MEFRGCRVQRFRVCRLSLQGLHVGFRVGFRSSRTCRRRLATDSAFVSYSTRASKAGYELLSTLRSRSYMGNYEVSEGCTRILDNSSYSSYDHELLSTLALL